MSVQRGGGRKASKRDVNLDAVVAGIAEIMAPMALAYRASGSEALKRYLRSTIYHMCRELEDFVEPWVSVKADRIAQTLPTPIDLAQFHYDDQPRFDPGRKNFHWEHYWTAGDLREQVLALAEPTPEAIAEVLARAQVVWVSKEEDAALTRCGHRSKREDPAACYRQAGISLR